MNMSLQAKISEEALTLDRSLVSDYCLLDQKRYSGKI